MKLPFAELTPELKRALRDAHDLLTPTALHVLPCDQAKAIPGDSCRCTLARAGRRSKMYKQLIAARNTVYLLDWKDKWWRAFSGANAIKVVIDTDLHRLTIPAEGITVGFFPPRGVRSKTYTRSVEFKEKRKASKERRKGQPPREYVHSDYLTLEGVRLGLGQAAV